MIPRFRPLVLSLLLAAAFGAAAQTEGGKAARFYEDEVEHSIDTFMSLVEPVIMIVMGFVVGFIVLAAVLPTVQMINQLS